MVHSPKPKVWGVGYGGLVETWDDLWPGDIYIPLHGMPYRYDGVQWRRLW